ncbi:MAG: BrnA antitoxin family protein [Phyllobacteriaceae bacterium]|jgi:predicted DNA binding CopG/RHH family protein|nr:BrnA antitoxin family protein [Phyllobacteriaceae bacterium]
MNGSENRLKPLPTFRTDQEAEDFVDNADLTEYDLSGGTFMRFEIKRKDKQINIRMPEDMLDAVKARAKERDIPYQRFIREAIEQALHKG